VTAPAGAIEVERLVSTIEADISPLMAGLEQAQRNLDQFQQRVSRTGQQLAQPVRLGIFNSDEADVLVRQLQEAGIQARALGGILGADVRRLRSPPMRAYNGQATCWGRCSSAPATWRLNCRGAPQPP
jgi:hypothetical protein